MVLDYVESYLYTIETFALPLGEPLLKQTIKNNYFYYVNVPCYGCKQNDFSERAYVLFIVQLQRGAVIIILRAQCRPIGSFKRRA